MYQSSSFVLFIPDLTVPKVASLDLIRCSALSEVFLLVVIVVYYYRGEGGGG